MLSGVEGLGFQVGLYEGFQKLEIPFKRVTGVV